MGPHYNMWMLVGSQPARNASRSTADDGVTEPAESCAELRIGDPREPLGEHLNLTGSEHGYNRVPHRRIERQRSLHQRQACDHGTAEKEVDALDQQRRTMLQLERGCRRRAQLQDAIATERGRPSHRGPFGADDRRPLRLESDEDPAAALGDDRRGELRHGDAHCSKALVALALTGRSG